MADEELNLKIYTWRRNSELKFKNMDWNLFNAIRQGIEDPIWRKVSANLSIGQNKAATQIRRNLK